VTTTERLGWCKIYEDHNSNLVRVYEMPVDGPPTVEELRDAIERDFERRLRDHERDGHSEPADSIRFPKLESEGPDAEKPVSAERSLG
jgi:hypothetical protein